MSDFSEKFWDFAEKHPIIFGTGIIITAYAATKTLDAIVSNIKLPRKTVYVMLPKK